MCELLTPEFVGFFVPKEFFHLTCLNWKVLMIIIVILERSFDEVKWNLQVKCLMKNENNFL